MNSIGKQIATSIVLSLVLSAIVFGLQQMESTAAFVHEKVWSIVIFSAILGLIVVLVSDWGLKTMDAQSRPNLFLGITVLRLLLSMAFVGIVLFVGIEDRIIWVANFFVAYLFYLVFEIYSILSNLRAISTAGEKP